MPNKRPLSSTEAPDTASTYERAKPEKEAGMGRLDTNTEATPRHKPDQAGNAVDNAHAPRQVNAEDVVNHRKGRPPTQSVEEAEAAKNAARRHPKDTGTP